MTESIDPLRDHLVRVLDWEEAHVGFEKAVKGIPAAKRGARAAGFEQSPWQLLEHIRLAQDDILDFCVNAKYVHSMKWPDDYWPADPEPPGDRSWTDSTAAYERSRRRMQDLARDVKDLTASVPTGKPSQTYLRAILMTADHTAYHVGQLVAATPRAGYLAPGMTPGRFA